MTDNPYPVGTTVFAKLKGYPWWPARIESDDDLPPNVSSKKPKQRPIWPVFFFGSYDYGWFGTSELKSFDPASAEKAKNSLKKGSALRTALSEALDPSLIRLQTKTLDLGEYDDEGEEYEQEPATPAKKKAAASSRAKKTSQKSEQATTDKKRRPSASEDLPAKRKMSKKTSAVTVEEEEEVPVLKKRPVSTSRSRLESDLKSVDDDISVGEGNNNRTRKSEDDIGDSGDHARVKKKIRSGQPNERLLKLRHKLQKLLLVEGLSDEVLVQNLDRADPIMTEVEAYDIDLQMLKDTKIGRLMKKISVLKFSQDQHKIVERSLKLIRQYKAMMDKAQENGEGISPAVEKSAETVMPVVEPTTAVVTQDTKIIGTEQGASEAIKPETAPAASALMTETSTSEQPNNHSKDSSALAPASAPESVSASAPASVPAPEPSAAPEPAPAPEPASTSAPETAPAAETVVTAVAPAIASSDIATSDPATTECKQDVEPAKVESAVV